MKFTELKYERPDVASVKVQFTQLIDQLKNAQSAQEQIEMIQKINTLRSHVDTTFQLAALRHVINTEDTFYDQENDYMDEMSPELEELVDLYYRALDASPFKQELRAEFGDHLFNIIEVKLKTFHPDIIEDLKLENSLNSKYTKLRTSAKILFDGKELNLAQMTPYYESKDRSVRKAAQEAASNFFRENEAAFDELYHEMVGVRHRIAKKLGFENYIPLAYMRLTRTDYNHEDVATYRKQVLEDLVPLTVSLKERQRNRLGLDTLNYYDESISFTSGNAGPKGDANWILENGKKMYRELSPETAEFFDFMVDSELMDLEAKKGKAGGGFCTFLPEHKAPYIFSNFNGTADDIGVLTHEAGHAFQVYQSRNYTLPEYNWPTLEACEIHSMSMEFFTYPWMESFFEEGVTKYKFTHLSEAILFIPYGVLVDEFQHFVYENPEVSPEVRKAKWRELEKKYLPARNYEDNDLLERGAYWYRQGHIFTDPFYYIDYTLAQVCAFQFLVKANDNREKAWADYLALCNKGGSMPFTELLKVAKLDSPFEAGSIKKIIPALQKILAEIDDTKL